MKKFLLIGAAVAALILLWLGWTLLSGPPSGKTRYQGRTVREWARLALVSPEQSERAEAGAALIAIGTNGVPELVALLDYRDPLLQRQLWNVGAWLPRKLRVGLLRQLNPPSASTLHHAAAHALKVLGTNALPAIPALGRALRSREAEVRWEASLALGQMGKPAVGELLQAAGNPSPEVQIPALRALAVIGPDAAAALPLLMERLSDPNPELRSEAAGTLAGLGSTAIPSLADGLRHPDALVRAGCATTLGKLGSRARSTVLALEALKTDPDVRVRSAAEAALATIPHRKSPAP